jgi:NitT/TauT family transport system substrate-binding protein
MLRYKFSVVVLAGCLLAACGPTGGAPAPSSQAPAAPAKPTSAPAAAAPASATTAPAAKPELAPLSLEVAVPAMTAFVWPFVAIKEGPVGAHERLTIDWTVTETDARAMQALLGGSVDFAEVAMDAVARAIDQGGDVVAIGGNVNRPPYALAVRQGVDSFPELRGKKFAVTDLRGGSTVVLKLLLQANGLRDDDYDLLPLGGTPNRYSALVNGAADAAILAQPADFKVQDEGYRLLAYTTDRDFQFTTYTMRRGWGEQNREKVHRFLRAMVAAHRWLHDPANREQAIELGMKAFRSSRSEMERTWDLYYRDNAGRVVPRNAELNLPGVETVLRTLGEQSEIRDHTPARYIDERPLQDVLRAS